MGGEVVSLVTEGSGDLHLTGALGDEVVLGTPRPAADSGDTGDHGPPPGPLHAVVSDGVITSLGDGPGAAAWAQALPPGRELASLVHPDDRILVRELLSVADRWALSGETAPAHPVVVRILDANDQERYLELVATTAGRDAPSTAVVSGWDVTRHIRRQQSLEQLALHDALTGLANRALFGERVHDELRRQRRTGAQVALMYADLDGFKEVNDSWGHRAGDLLLNALANRLRGCLRPGDTLARLGGDEFGICCGDLADVDAALAVAHRLVDAATAPVSLGGVVVRVSISVGVAMAVESDAADGGTRLLARADLAMYAAKHAGRERVALAPVPGE